MFPEGASIVDAPSPPNNLALVSPSINLRENRVKVP